MRSTTEFPKLKLYVVLACNVSFHCIWRYLFPMDEGIILVYFIGGEIIRFLLISFSVIYSSKSILNSLRSLGTLILVVSILDPTIFGGIVSLPPPMGEPTLAQLTKTNAKKSQRRNCFIIKIRY